MIVFLKISNQQSVRVYFEQNSFMNRLTKLVVIDYDPKMLNLYKRNLSSWWSWVRDVVMYKNVFGTKVNIYFWPNVFPGVTIQHQSPGRQSPKSSAQEFLRLVFLGSHWRCRKTHLRGQWAQKYKCFFVTKERSISSPMIIKACSHTSSWTADGSLQHLSKSSIILTCNLPGINSTNYQSCVVMEDLASSLVLWRSHLTL